MIKTKNDKLIVRSWPAPPHENPFIDIVTRLIFNQDEKVFSANPSILKTVIRKQDLFVIHWPDALFWNFPSKRKLWLNIFKVLLTLSVLRLRGTKILWFVHNLAPHDLRPDLFYSWRVLVKGIGRLTHMWITLSPSTFEPVIARYPILARKPHTYIWHPLYPNHYSGSDVTARSELNVSDKITVFSHAGGLRLSKRLVELSEIFDTFAPPQSLLILAGNPKNEVDERLLKVSKVSKSLHYLPGRLSAEDFDRILTATDVFVAPYSDFLHSGAIIHAISRSCVIVAPQAPFVEDLSRAIGSEWVVQYHGDLDASTLHKAAEYAQMLKGQNPCLEQITSPDNASRVRNMFTDIGIV